VELHGSLQLAGGIKEMVSSAPRGSERERTRRDEKSSKEKIKGVDIKQLLFSL